jgi:site-specific DNA-methyltransferase (adenine-specific)
MTLSGTSIRNTVALGNCINLMKQIPSRSVNLVLTDPPYITRYVDRSGRTVINDDNARWLEPSFEEMYRVLSKDSFCISFYGWAKADLFLATWRKVGFRPVGHLVFRKSYASSARFVRYEHEQAYLLAKGNPDLPEFPLGDVIEWPKPTGNRLHPTQKPIEVLKPLVRAFSSRGDLVLDPFCGSGSTLLAAREMRRDYIGFEMDAAHHATAARRLARRPNG